MPQNNCTCFWCGKEFYRKPRYIYKGKLIFCRNACRTLYFNSIRTPEQIKKDRIKKSKYDKDRREKLGETLLKRRRECWKRNYDPVKASIVRKKNMHKHVEYCRQPEYRKWKHEYDQQYRYKKLYGEFCECMILVTKIKKEVCKIVPDSIERMKMRGNYYRRIERNKLRQGMKYDWFSSWEKYKSNF
jgi:hypothetical protein